LDLRASLLAWAPRIDGVTLVGARIEVQRSADGRIGVRGLGPLGGGDGTGAAYFLREGHFSLADSRVYWTDSFAGVPTLEFRIERLDLVNHGARHRLRVQGRPPGDPAGELTLLADLQGAPGRPAEWSGTVYTDWRGSDLARVLRGRLPSGLRLATDGLHITTWTQLTASEPTRITARVWLDDLVLRRHRADADAPDDGNDIGTTQLLRLGDTGALVRWEQNRRGWQLRVPELKLFGNLLRAEKTALRVAGSTAAGGTGQRIEAWLAGLPLAQLAEVARFAATNDLPPALHQVLHGRVGGQLEDLRLRLDHTGGPETAVTHWLANGRVTGLAVGPSVAAADPNEGVSDTSAPGAEPTGPIPSFSGVDLRFSTGPDRGAIVVAARDVQLDPRPHTIEPLKLTRLAGRMAWRRTANGIELWSRALTADTPDVSTLSRVALHTLPDAPPYIDLHTHIRGGDADAVPRYLPASKMDDRLEDWLGRAIVAGQLTSGDLLLRGPLGDFPFDAGNGWFRLELRVHDGVLDYQPSPPEPSGPGMSAAAGESRLRQHSWPRLEDMDVTLRFDRRRLDIELAAARILSTNVTSGSARLPNLWQPEHMHLEAEGTGPLTDGLAVLADTPLARKLGGIPRALAAEGSGRLKLKLDVPLRRGLGFGYAGTLAFSEQATVTLRDAELRLTDIAGSLRFDASGVHADAIAARLGEQALRLDIETHRADTAAGAGRTDITARGSTAIEHLAAAWPSPWWALASGKADWQLRASLSNTDVTDARPPLDLTLESDLAAVELDLPPPFGKPAGTRRELRADTRLAPDAPLAVTARLGDLGVRAELAQTDDALVPRRVAVDLSQLPETLPDDAGIAVRGRLGVVDLGVWLNWRRTHAALLAPGDVLRTESDLPLLPMRFSAEALELGAMRFEDVRADLNRGTGGVWRIGLEAAGNSASVRLPAGDTQPVRVRLDTLDVAPLLAVRQKRTRPVGAGPDPRRLPPLSLQIEALRRGSDELGRLRLELARTVDGLAARDLSLTGPLVTANGNGRWTRDATGYTETAIDIDLRSEDLGELLRQAGYYSAMTGAPSRADLALTWPGGPEQFQLERARGSLALDIAAGRLLEVEPGVGRMLGVLNLGALERRLSLDFSDVLDTGFTFDSINGRLTIGSGIARISQLDILSSTADIRVRGSTNLVDQTFDQNVRVTPKIGTGVAIAGAVAGGPLVGAAVLLADKVSGNAVSGLASYEYRVTGPWAEPDIRRVSGSNGVRSVPDLLLPEDRVDASDGTPAAAGGRGGAQTPPRAVSPFLDAD
ncbi:MAG: YhdP family protein, partial [Thiohalocapsa sp.]